MKPASASSKKPDSAPVDEPVSDSQGIDALRAGQIGVGVLCVIIVAWFLLHNILHVI